MSESDSWQQANLRRVESAASKWADYSGSREPPRPWIRYPGMSFLPFAGVAAYRANLPAAALAEQGYCALAWFPTDNQDNPGEWLVPSDRVFDVFVYVRALSDSAFVSWAQKHGKKLVADCDDDLTGEYRYQNVRDKANYDRFRGFFREIVDAITVSTPYLASRIRQWAPGKPVYVLPNCVHWLDWQYIPKAEAFTVALTGGPSHDADWQVLTDVFPRIMQEYPNVRLILAGGVPDYFAPVVADFEDRVELHKWMDYRQYPEVVGRAHLGLCPVDPSDRFNWSKSGIKAIELLASGAAVVASDLNIYRRVLGRNRRGLLVPHTEEGWYEGIKTMIENERLRHKLTERGRRWVRRNRCFDRTWHLWWQTYKEIAAL